MLSGGLVGCSVDYDKVQGPEPRQFKKTNFDRPAPEEGEVGVGVPVTPFTPEQGGQPGSIFLQGAIAEVATQIPLTGSKVRYLSSHGLGKDGARAEVAELSQPRVEKRSPPNTFGLTDGEFENKLFAFGCEGRDLSPYTRETPASTDRIAPSFFSEQIKNVHAEKIILCGRDPLAATKNVYLLAREVILVENSFALVGPDSQSFSVTARRLKLVGRNDWRSKPAATTPADRRSTIHIAVAEKVDDADGSLDVIAEGKDYTERIEGR